MVYKMPADKQPAKQKHFDIETPSGATYRLPLLNRLRPALAAKVARAGDNQNAQLVGVQDVFDQLAPGLFDELESADQLQGLMQAWQEESGITLGESQPSSEG